MRDSNAVVCLYADSNGIAARVIWPDAISLTSDNHITCRGYCTLRREFRTFRLDRMQGCHPLTTPDDYEPQPVATA
jgi:predicted DNA-binding transcriptional regulator YafY